MNGGTTICLCPTEIFSVFAVHNVSTSEKKGPGKGASAKTAVSKAEKREPAPLFEGAPKTIRSYLEDTYQYEQEGVQILDVKVSPTSEGESVVACNATVFYPQGGGQPSDRGTMSCAASGCVFEVTMVKADTNGVVLHTGKFRGQGSNGGFQAGDVVLQTIDKNLRRLHARIHSAGHVLDTAMFNLGEEFKHLVPTKGYHFVDGPWVEYEGKLPDPLKNRLADLLQAEMRRVVEANFPTQVEEVDGADVNPLYSGTGFPANDRVRVVAVGGPLKCPCGGTHVKNAGEIGEVGITRVKCKKNIVKINYSVGVEPEV